jgi:hypothetical protein
MAMGGRHTHDANWHGTGMRTGKGMAMGGRYTHDANWHGTGMRTGKGMAMGGRHTHEMAVLAVPRTHSRASNTHNFPHRATSQHALDTFEARK